MPDISATIRSILAADATVSGLVSTRIRSDFISQGETMPAIAYWVVTTTPSEHLTGIADIARARIRIECYATTRSGSHTLGDAVRLALELSNRGDNSGQFINSISLTSGESDLIDRPERGTDQRRFITQMDFDVHYRTTTS